MGVATPAEEEGEAHTRAYRANLRLYAVGQAVSVLGDRVATIAFVFLVIHLTRSPAPALALFYACRTVPTLILGLVVGVLVDHWDRRRLMIVCDLARAVLMASVPLLTLFSLALLYPVVLALYALTLLFETAAAAAIPDFVPEDRMMAANSLLTGIETGGDLAYAAGGVLVVALGYRWPFLFDAATFAFSAAMVWCMRFRSNPSGPLPDLGGALRSVREGARYVLEQPFLKWTTLTFVIAPLAGGVVYVLQPLYASRALGRSHGLVGPLHNGAVRFSLLEVALGIGMLTGAALAPRLATRMARGRLIGAGLVGMGLAYAALFFVTNFYLACAVVLVQGVCNLLFIVPSMTLSQLLTPSHIRGRVVGARRVVINAALTIGSVVAGPLLLVTPIHITWLIVGAVVCLGSLPIWLHVEVRRQP